MERNKFSIWEGNIRFVVWAIGIVVLVATPIISQGQRIDQLEKGSEKIIELHEQIVKDIEEIKIENAKRTALEEKIAEDVAYIKSKQNGVVYIRENTP